MPVTSAFASSRPSVSELAPGPQVIATCFPWALRANMPGPSPCEISCMTAKATVAFARHFSRPAQGLQKSSLLLIGTITLFHSRVHEVFEEDLLRSLFLTLDAR